MPKTTIKISHGLIWKLVESFDADEIAHHNGYHCAEQFVEKYKGKVLILNEIQQVDSEYNP